MASGRLQDPKPQHDRVALAALVAQRQPESVDLDGWQAIDAEERARGREQGRNRVKCTDLATMLRTARGAAGSTTPEQTDF
jgi:ferredoxin--NADP+ reductase